MFLDERKIKILEAIIDDYIKTAEPVGSRTIEKKYDIGISSATIRNEMADLEELGFILQPHTSSGRIPSDKGYRLYVDEMLKNSKIPLSKRKQIDSLLKKTYSSLENFVKDLSDLISELTNYTVVTSKTHKSDSYIRNIQLIAIDTNSILLVTVINKNTVKNSILRVSETVQQEVLTPIAKILNDSLCNLTLNDINLSLISQIKRQLGKYQNILEPILDVITEIINENDIPEYYTTGLTNILNFPEFTDVQVAKELLSVMENKNLLTNLIKNDIENSNIYNSDVSIKIGNENLSPYVKDCSIITCKCELEDEACCLISIIGPKRMDYENSISILKTIIKSIESKKGGWNER